MWLLLIFIYFCLCPFLTDMAYDSSARFAIFKHPKKQKRNSRTKRPAETTKKRKVKKKCLLNPSPTVLPLWMSSFSGNVFPQHSHGMPVVWCASCGIVARPLSALSACAAVTHPSGGASLNRAPPSHSWNNLLRIRLRVHECRSRRM